MIERIAALVWTWTSNGGGAAEACDYRPGHPALVQGVRCVCPGRAIVFGGFVRGNRGTSVRALLSLPTATGALACAASLSGRWLSCGPKPEAHWPIPHPIRLALRRSSGLAGLCWIDGAKRVSTLCRTDSVEGQAALLPCARSSSGKLSHTHASTSAAALTRAPCATGFASR